MVSTDRGLTFSKARLVATYDPFVSHPVLRERRSRVWRPPLDCPSGQTFPRFDLAGPSIAADNVNGTIVLAFQVRQSRARARSSTCSRTMAGHLEHPPALLAPSTSGHQFFPWITASAGRVSAIWYDSRGDSTYAPTRAPCNDATGHVSACLNVRYAESTDGGATWGSSIQVTDTPTNPNYEQFGGRLVPFFGDYITVAAVGDTVGAVLDRSARHRRGSRPNRRRRWCRRRR